MSVFSFIIAALTGLGTLALIWESRRKRGTTSPGAERLRRGTGHALLGLQEFIEPSVEYVFETQNREQKDEDDDQGEGDSPDAIRADLAASLASARIDPEEVRRQLSAATRAGLDWALTYDQAVHEELSARPFKAPSIPPAWRVAPRE